MRGDVDPNGRDLDHQLDRLDDRLADPDHLDADHLDERMQPGSDLLGAVLGVDLIASLRGLGNGTRTPADRASIVPGAIVRRDTWADSTGIIVLDIDDAGFTAWAPEIADSVWYAFDDSWLLVC